MTNQPTPNLDGELESLEKVLGFRVSSSGADMRVTIGSRKTWVNSEDAIGLRDAILDWHKSQLTQHTDRAVAEKREDLWQKISDIERVIVQIPVSYTPNSQVLKIPKEDERNKVYSVSATPFEHIEKVFQETATLKAKGEK